MDDTWRKVRGSKIAVDGTVIRLAMETIDGRVVEFHLVPEAVSLLVAELVNAKAKALTVAGMGLDSQLDPVHMRHPIEAERLIRTNYVDRGRALVQVVTASGGQFEFLIPLDGAEVREARER